MDFSRGGVKLKLGFIGLGRMGHNVVLNLIDKKHKVVVFNRHPDKVKKIAKQGAIGAYSLEELVQKLPKPRVVVLMITAGKPVDAVMKGLLPLLDKGDTIVEGGNSWYEDDLRRSKLCKKKGINFVDMGTSGGLMGARYGASLMIGGDKKIFKQYEKMFKDIATKNGYGYMGPTGSGHFVKMVHNGIEYAIEEAYGEGYELLDKSRYKYDYEKVSTVWNNGSIIRSFLVEKALDAFKKDPKLRKFKGVIGGGETGQWTLNQAKKEKVEMETLKHAVKKRKQSYKKQSFATKVISAMRWEFGGHLEGHKESKK